MVLKGAQGGSDDRLSGGIRLSGGMVYRMRDGPDALTSRLPHFITFLDFGGCTANSDVIHEQIDVGLFLHNRLDEITGRTLGN